ncbi:MAG TPA: hypothetical protein VGT24_04640 [Candidatus Acidoferrales bacterium]|nr:hypothetical protein [Candidatus Acidoferrales bacterium]
MRKAILISFTLVLVLGLMPSTRAAAAAAKPSLAALPQGAPLKTIQGTVKADGDKITFVADGDGKSWEVMNPDTLKAHAGHHVEVSAHVYADKNSIHVMSVKMVKKPG